ncbi:MAG TPA: transaldolase family protein [Anaerolineaceae bacterium]
MSYRNPLHETVMTSPTDVWNDSCAISELTYSLENGSVGATTNPTIVLGVLKKEMHLWKDRIYQIIAENPTWSEIEITWKLIEEMAAKGASLLEPVFHRYNGRKGRLSIQTNPMFYRNTQAIVAQAVHFNTLAPNMNVKMPVTKAGVAAIEESTYQGVSINATVNFTVAGAIAAAEAVERGLKRREAEGKDTATMSPMITIMIGRVDDWLKVVAKRDGITLDPGYLEWGGVAVMKKAYGIFKQRGYRGRLLAAAYRNHMHWSEFIGGDMSMTLPYEWQVLFNASDVEVKPRIDVPVRPEIVETLYTKFVDFRKAYDEDGLTLEQLDTYGATVRTLRAFIESYHELMGVIRDFMLPNPDKKS